MTDRLTFQARANSWPEIFLLRDDGCEAAMAIFAVGTAMRVRTEERLLREAFGAEFEEYARRVPAVIPGPALIQPRAPR